MLHKLTERQRVSVYSYELAKPAGCSCQTRHEANEVTLFPVSAFLSPPCVLREGGGLQLSSIDVSIQFNILYLHAYAVFFFKKKN